MMVEGLLGITFDALLGEGAHGAVYRAHHEGLDIEVAVKQLKGLSAKELGRGLAEARLMARLDHPNLLRIYDVRQQGGSLFLLCELMDGGSLEGRSSLDFEELAALTAQLLSGLQALHQAKILHRDLKPANFLRRSADGRVKLADLGIAIEESALDKEHGLTGTLPFMAPELLESPPRFSVRSDLYALGLSVTCLALPEVPWPSSWAEIVHWISSNERPSLRTARPDLPAGFSLLLDQLCQQAPEDRPSSAAEALVLLSRVPQPRRAAPQSQGAVGPWVLGGELYRSTNWLMHAATHQQSGTAARLCFLQRHGPLAGKEHLILQSAARASSLEHPGLLPVLDWGEASAGAYVVTAAQGHNLQVYVEASGPLAEVEALRAAMQLARALAYLHEKGLVYQMVEPGSAHISFDGRAVQLSWPVFCVPRGSAARDESGRAQRVYVPRYAAPEALEDSLIEPASDLYGLGQLLFFLLSGYALHQRESLMETLLLKTEAPRDLSARLPLITRPTLRVLEALLQPDPAARPQSAQEVAQSLQLIAERLIG